MQKPPNDSIMCVLIGPFGYTMCSVSSWAVWAGGLLIPGKDGACYF